ncbi:hypothetical protein [uncultured Flavobacterium sp.]|uniref:hypothetical protein n=1 Tax=uncultured Flavobacterium sp. TaxID=165435 RepID=UPI0025F03605|nr:hypothetical protein [uncultured Flavobacterium sp.]
MKELFIVGKDGCVKKINATITISESFSKMEEGFSSYNHSCSGVIENARELKKQLDKLLYRKSYFERFYDSVSNFLSGGKPFLPKELKSY